MKKIISAAVIMLVFFCDLTSWGQTAVNAQSRVTKIAILPLKNIKGDKLDEWIGEGTAEMLTTKLMSIPSLRMVERMQIRKIIDERDLVAAYGDSSAANKIGKILATDRLVIGSFAKNADEIMFTVRVVDVGTGEIFNSATVRANEKKIFDAMFELADAVIKSFDKKVVIVDKTSSLVEAPQQERIVLTQEQLAKLKNWGTTSPDAWQEFARGVGASDPEKKIEHFSKALALDKGYTFAYICRSAAYIQTKDLDKAMADAERAIQLEPRLPLGYSIRASIFGLKNNWEKAISNYEAIVSLVQKGQDGVDLADCYYRMGKAYEVLGNFGKAMEYANRSVEKDPLNPEAILLQATLNQRLGKNELFKTGVEKAISLLSDRISLNSKDMMAYLARTTAYFWKGEYAKALADCNKYLELDPNEGYGYSTRGAIYMQIPDGMPKALADFSKAIEKGYCTDAVLLNRGRILAYVEKKYDKAIEDFDRAIKINPLNSELFFERSQALEDSGKSEQSLEDLSKAIELDRSNPEYYNARAYQYNKLGQPDQAIVDSSKAIEISPDFPNPYRHRGNAFRAKGQYDKAIADYDKSIKLKPNAKTFLERAKAYFLQKNYAKAWEDVNECKKLKGMIDETFLAELQKESGRKE